MEELSGFTLAYSEFEVDYKELISLVSFEKHVNWRLNKQTK
jgi:hypothetical protein